MIISMYSEKTENVRIPRHEFNIYKRVSVHFVNWSRGIMLTCQDIVPSVCLSVCYQNGNSIVHFEYDQFKHDEIKVIWNNMIIYTIISIIMNDLNELYTWKKTCFFLSNKNNGRHAYNARLHTTSMLCIAAQLLLPGKYSTYITSANLGGEFHIL